MPDTAAFAQYLPNFLFIMMRAGIFLSMIPFFSSKNLPLQFKIGFLIALALILSPVVEFKIGEASLPLLVIREVIFSMVLGLSVRFVFLAFEMAGQIMSNSMGLSIATVFNPEMGQSTEIARLQGIIAMLLFLAMDAHHDLIYIFVRSYELVPAGQINLQALMPEGIALIGKVFVIGIKLAAPVTVGTVIVNFLLGFLYKAAPQMNIFFVSMPVHLALGFVIMLLSVPVFVHVLGGYFGDIQREMIRIISIAKG
ncbi:MAG: flagellar biosynthetic protein FliR [Thermodesulfovibrionales bacterium]